MRWDWSEIFGLKMCSNEKGASRQVMHWWGGRLTEGTGLQPFHCLSAIHEAWPLTWTYTSASTCTYLHRCFCTLSLSGLPLLTKLLDNSVTVLFVHRQVVWRFPFVLNYLLQQSQHWEHQKSRQNIESNTIFKWFRERCVRWATWSTLEIKDKKDHYALLR